METVYNHLVEMVIAVGINDDTGLNAAEPQPPPLFHHENTMFCTAFNTEILAAISNRVAVFPFEPEPHDLSYPPGSGKHSKQARETAQGNIYKTWANSKIHARTLMKKKRSKGAGASLHNRSSSFSVFDFAHQGMASRSLSLKAADLPLNAETLQSLMTLCFPDGAYLKDHDEPSSVHYLPLTDITGDHSYAVCITLYQPYTTEKCCEDGRWLCSRYCGTSQLEDDNQSQIIYVPTCLVAISKQPYFTVLHDCLSKLAQSFKLEGMEWKHLLKLFTLHLTSIPIPPCSPLHIKFELLQDIFIEVAGAEYPGMMVSDFPVFMPFLCLSVDQVTLILTAILTEQRIVFLSAHSTLLVLVCQALQHLLYPFKWMHTYVPLLSWNLVELVEAPGTFIMGCHSHHRRFIEKVDGLVIIDLDVATIKVCPTLTLPVMPHAPVKVFSMAVQQAKRQNDWLATSRPTMFTHQEYRSSESKHRTQVNRSLQMACIELMSNLFRDVFLHCNKEKRFFHKEHFLGSLDDQDKPFYEMVLQTDMFSEFLKVRLSPNLQPDYWDDFLEHSKPYHRNTFTARQDLSLVPGHKSQTVSTLSTQISFISVKSEPKILCLPLFVYRLNHQYISNCLLEVNNMMKVKSAADVRAACAYLKGIYLAAQNKKTEALEAFHEVESYNSRLFPISFVAELLKSLSLDEKAAVHSSFMYQQSVLLQEAEHYHGDSKNTEQPIIMELSKIPEANIDQQGFTDLVHLLFDLIPDREATNRLFDALTLGERIVVDPLTFEEFYKSWKENELMLQQVQIPAGLLDPEEVLLKVSDMCKCSYGTGRLALTPKRLFFLPGGSKKYREIIQLRNIKQIEIIQQRSLLKPASALKIAHVDDKVRSFSATLKDACTEWCFLLNEMWAGKVLADETRNPNLVYRAAQNVLLMNAFIQSGRSELSNHSGYEMEEVESLSYFYQRKCANISVPQETSQFLQHDLDPSCHEEVRTAVVSLLYTTGISRASSTQDCNPCLWCGLESGKLCIYDAISWSLDVQLALSSQRLTCLASVQDKVWVGSADGHIYIVNRKTKIANQTLSDHQTTVTGFTDVDNESLFSCSLDGHILRWQARTNQLVSDIKIAGTNNLKSIHYHNQHLWCLTSDHLLLVSTNGNVLRTVSMEMPGQPGNCMQLDSFLLTAQNEIWLACGQLGQIAVYFADTIEQKGIIYTGHHNMSPMISIADKVWVGTQVGHLLIINSFTNKLEITLYAHKDSVTSLCSASDRYVMSGSGQLEGRVSIWKIPAGYL